MTDSTYNSITARQVAGAIKSISSNSSKVQDALHRAYRGAFVCVVRDGNADPLSRLATLLESGKVPGFKSGDLLYCIRHFAGRVLKVQRQDGRTTIKMAPRWQKKLAGAPEELFNDLERAGYFWSVAPALRKQARAEKAPRQYDAGKVMQREHKRLQSMAEQAEKEGLQDVAAMYRAAAKSLNADRALLIQRNEGSALAAAS